MGKWACSGARHAPDCLRTNNNNEEEGEMSRTEKTTMTWICDRCGRDMPGAAYGYEIADVTVRWTACDMMGNGAGGTTRHDLCNRCAVELRAFLRERPCP